MRAVIPGFKLDCMESFKRLAVIKCFTIMFHFSGYKELLYLRGIRLRGSAESFHLSVLAPVITEGQTGIVGFI